MAEINQQFIYNLTSRISRLKEMTDAVTSKIDGTANGKPLASTVHTEIQDTINKEVAEIRKTIVSFARSQYCALLKVIEPLLPLVDLDITDLGSVIQAVKAIISILLGPYYKALKAQIALIEAVVQLSVAMLEMVNYLVSQGFTVTVEPISPSEITNCPVDQVLTGDFDSFPSIV